MTMNGTKSRGTQRLSALLLLSLSSSIACGGGGEATDAAQDSATAAAPAAAAPAQSAGAAGRPASTPTQQAPTTNTGAATSSATAGSPAAAAAPATTGAAGGGAAGAAATQSPDATPAAAAGSGAGPSAAAGASAAAGTSAAAGASEGAPEAPREDLGKGDGSDVIAIGDSWMNLGATGIQQSLVRLSMQPYRTYGVPGTRLLDEVIPSQYTSAKRANPDIKTVVMTGGGNDILLTGAGVDRSTAGPATMGQIDMIGVRLVELWNEMGADGVQDVVYIEYSRGGGSEAAVNYATEALKPLCDNHEAVRCHWVDSDDFLMKMLSADGIHPTGDGCNKIATGVIG
jgi:hypothetical protein